MPQTLTIYLDDDKVVAQLKQHAVRTDRSVSWIVRNLLQDYLQQHEPVIEDLVVKT